MSPAAEPSARKAAGKAVAAATGARRGRKAGEPSAPSSVGAASEAPFTVFLDRDGVFNPDPKFGLRSAKHFQMLPGAAEAHARLKRAGMRTCLVTNQPWVGLLTATPGMIHRVHARLQQELEAAGARLDRIEAAFAPPLGSFARGPWRRRKPNPGMLEDAAAAWAKLGQAFDKARAVMVGDTPRDAGAAHAFGIPCYLLSTTYPREVLAEAARGKGVRIVADLAEAVDDLLRREGVEPAASGRGTRSQPRRRRLS